MSIELKRDLKNAQVKAWRKEEDQEAKKQKKHDVMAKLNLLEATSKRASLKENS